MADKLKGRADLSNLPSPFVPGYRLKASDMNTIAGVLSDLGGFDSHRDWKEQRSRQIWGYNDSLSDINAGQIVEFNSVRSVYPVVIGIQVPSANNLELIGITSQKIPSLSIGKISVYGITYVQYTGTAPPIGARLGTTTAQVQIDGPFLVIDPYITMDGVDYASVLISRGVGDNRPQMVKSKSIMSYDDVLYQVCYIEADGTEGSTFTLRRPNGVKVNIGDTGFIGQDSSGQNIFMPCHARSDENLTLRIESRTNDWASGIGAIWIRTDLY
jgi:hypothetical protein